MIDAHVHHIDLNQFRYPWMEHDEFAPLRHEYLPGDYRAEVLAAGVKLEGWVHMQAEVDRATDPVKETEWVSRLADEARGQGLPGPLGCVAYADLRAEDLDGVLRRHAQYPLTRGVRDSAWFDPASTRDDIQRENPLSDPAWRRGFEALATFGLSFDLQVWPHQLSQAAALVATTPEVPVVLDHLGLPNPSEDSELGTWREGIRELGSVPHVCAKLSGFSLLGSARRPEIVGPIVAELIECFGPSRCMFASNFPVDRLAGDFASVYDLALDALSDLPEAARAEVLGATARRFYRLTR